MSERSFFDANILVYTDDHSAPAKRDRAIELITKARQLRSGVVSTQVLQEYFVAATRKLGVPPALAGRKVELFGQLDLVLLDLPAIQRAIELHRLHPVSFWDALIVAAAERARCRYLVTEDLQAGWRPAGLEVVNPFG